MLWLGSVILRKGIPDLIEAARLLESRGRSNVRFTVAGEIGIAQDKVANAPANMEFVGRVLRADAARLYAQADLFVLPTISDGFAITQLESIAHGLPVVTTPRCGEVVTNGEDGLIVPPGDALALANAIERLVHQRDARTEMARSARNKARHFSLDNLQTTLEEAVSAKIGG